MTKKNSLLIAFMVALSLNVLAAEKISLWDITAGKYAAENLRSLQPLADGVSFAQISQQRDKILKYAFASGEQTGVIFDASLCEGAEIKGIDDYKASPDDRYLLIATNSQRIYRHA